MPGMDGLETLIEVGKINPEITRIMLTGYATMESAIESVNAGIDGFLTKPFENIELRAKVREYNVKKRLKQFVSEQVLMELQKDVRIMIPRKQVVTVLFTDIRGFSGLSERMTAGRAFPDCSICIIFHPSTISSMNIMEPWINISETASWGCSVRLYQYGDDAHEGSLKRYADEGRNGQHQ